MLQIPTSDRQSRAHADAHALRRAAFARLWAALLCPWGASRHEKKAAPLRGRPESCRP